MSKPKFRYRVNFVFHAAVQILDLPPNFGVINVKEGIWVNEDLEFDSMMNARYWIPPSQIRYVEKVPL